MALSLHHSTEYFVLDASGSRPGDRRWTADAACTTLGSQDEANTWDYRKLVSASFHAKANVGIRVHYSSPDISGGARKEDGEKWLKSGSLGEESSDGRISVLHKF